MSYHTTLRSVGGSTMFAVPKAILEALGWKRGARVALTVDRGQLVAQRPRYTLDELIASTDFDAYRKAGEEWDRAPVVGKEVF
jgi:antitoxin ChpS